MTTATQKVWPTPAGPSVSEGPCDDGGRLGLGAGAEALEGVRRAVLGDAVHRVGWSGR
jgi:hypothetical protein